MSNDDKHTSKLSSSTPWYACSSTKAQYISSSANVPDSSRKQVELSQISQIHSVSRVSSHLGFELLEILMMLVLSHTVAKHPSRDFVDQSDPLQAFLCPTIA